jgi:hypothetical protein
VFEKELYETVSMKEIMAVTEMAAFPNDDVATFMNMMAKENKVMLHEGKVYLI